MLEILCKWCLDTDQTVKEFLPLMGIHSVFDQVTEEQLEMEKASKEGATNFADMLDDQGAA